MVREDKTPAAVLLPEQHAVLERLLASPLIARAPRLRGFLAYVSQCMLDGRLDEVTEQQIGCRVFGRPEGYNHTEDNIVRVTARNLRAKLEEYFATEGLAEEWIVEIPKGRYLPTFRPRELPEKFDTVPASAQEYILQPSLHLGPREILAWGLCATLAVGLAAALWLMPTPARSAAGGLVSALFPNPAERVTVVIVDSDLQLYRFVENRTVPLDLYLGGRYLQPGGSPTDTPMPPGLSRFFRNGGNKNTSFSSAVMASRLFQVMPAGQVEVRHPTQLNSRDFQRNHAIILGGPWVNPWGQLFESKLNFRIVTGEDATGSMVKNGVPQPGELDIYATSRDGAVETSYARLALLPNLGGVGKVLLLGATTSGAIEAAGDFLLRREFLDALLQLLHLEPGDRIPYFELVLEVKAVDVTPQGMRIVAHRSIASPVR